MPVLDWIGKAQVVNHANEVPFHVLERSYSYGAKEKAKKDNGSENKIIHGDNLVALKSLLPEYEGRVKCIYIDPPYNTGNEGWVYNDNVNDPRIRKWLGEVVGKEGEDLSRHDKWLCMMYPRLKLLQRLLADDGAIFISIDDNEQANLKLICDEIFGVGNFITDIIWEKSDSPRNDVKLFSSKHDHILMYVKRVDTFQINKIRLADIPRHYNKTDDIGRRYYLKPLRSMGQNDAREARPNLYFGLQAPDGSEVFPVRGDGSDGNWRWSQNKVLAEKERIEWIKGKSGWSVYYRIYADEQMERPPETIWYNKDIGSNRTSMMEIKEIFTSEKNFDTPKPTRLVERILQIATDKDSIVLDSFAGSGTTAHAVLNLNKADGGNRKFILVEMMDYADSITAERVKRVIGGYGEGNKKTEGTGGDFSFYEVGEPLFADGALNEDVAEEKIRAYIWYTETHTPYRKPSDGNAAFLGSADGTAYYFHYKKGETTTLDSAFLRSIKTNAERYVIYADVCVLSPDMMEKHGIEFRKIPRDIKRV